MIALAFILAFAAQFMLVTGQVLLKRAVMAPHPAKFALAIGSMTLYFFTWLGVARYIPLSQLAPFDACGPVLLVIWVRLTLNERLSLRAWLGVITILAGVTLISLS
jgi:drug/metabolite transporter (DMT)-like permease